MNKKENESLFSAVGLNKREEVARILDMHPGEIDVYGISNLNCRDKTPLMYAMQCGHFDLVYWLLERGASVTARMSGGPGYSVIVLAARLGHPMAADFSRFLELTEELIRRGADPSDALPTAVGQYQNFGDNPERMIRLLLQHGADPSTRIGGFTMHEQMERVGDMRYPKAVRDLLKLPDSRPDA